LNSIRAALIGFGYAGRTFHAPLIAHSKGLQLAAIQSSRAAEASAMWPEARLYTAPEALLEAADIDLVVIATPNDTHFPLARQALLAGKHVVVDKPFTTTLGEAHELGELAQQQGALLSVFHNRRWDADFLTLQALLAQGTLGRIVHFESHFDRYRPVVRQRWREAPGAGTGLWFDLGPHLVDQALQLFGLPQSVSADLAIQRDGALVDDYFHVQLRYADKRVILHGSTLMSGGTPRFTVHGALGSYTKSGLDTQEDTLKSGLLPGTENWGIDPLPGTLYTQTGECTNATPVANLPGDYRRYYEAITTAISTGSGNPVPADEAIAVMAIIGLAQESHTQGRVLEVFPVR
jgi:predicted dehydrogenase